MLAQSQGSTRAAAPPSIFLDILVKIWNWRDRLRPTREYISTGPAVCGTPSSMSGPSLIAYFSQSTFATIGDWPTLATL